MADKCRVGKCERTPERKTGVLTRVYHSVLRLIYTLWKNNTDYIPDYKPS
jgi:hypothetical protein